MFQLRGRRSLVAVPVILAALALAACSSPAGQGAASSAPTDGDAAAARFVTCLTGEGQTAKILDAGMVGLLQPGAPDGGGETPLDGASESNGTISLGEGGEGMSMTFSDDDGNWLAASSADSYPDEGGQREAWTACEKEVPEFTQATPDLGGSDTLQNLKEAAKNQTTTALAFATCARKNGYADFADPNADGELELPTGITEDEAEALLKACAPAAGEVAPAITQASMNALDFDWVALASEYFPGGVAVGGVGGTDR